MEEKKTEQDKQGTLEQQIDGSGAVMQALLRIAAVERALINKGLLTEDELAKELALVVSEVADTIRDLQNERGR